MGFLGKRKRKFCRISLCFTWPEAVLFILSDHLTEITKVEKICLNLLKCIFYMLEFLVSVFFSFLFFLPSPSLFRLQKLFPFFFCEILSECFTRLMNRFLAENLIFAWPLCIVKNITCHPCTYNDRIWFLGLFFKSLGGNFFKIWRSVKRIGKKNISKIFFILIRVLNRIRTTLMKRYCKEPDICSYFLLEYFNN